MARKVVAAIPPCSPPGRSIAVSVGVALLAPVRAATLTPEAWLATADRAMYAAKRDGGNGFVVETCTSGGA